MSLEDLICMIVQNGFSIAVAAYLLVRMESRLDALTEAIRELRFSIPKQNIPKQYESNSL